MIGALNTRHLESAVHTVGKANTQRIERKHLTLRIRIKRLARRTICFSKTTLMHDTVIGLLFSASALPHQSSDFLHR
jgi:insertion element IS1 protein InsB